MEGVKRLHCVVSGTTVMARGLPWLLPQRCDKRAKRAKDPYFLHLPARYPIWLYHLKLLILPKLQGSTQRQQRENEQDRAHNEQNLPSLSSPAHSAILLHCFDNVKATKIKKTEIRACQKSC